MKIPTIKPLFENDKLRSEVVHLSPGRLLQKAYFWAYQPGFLAILALGALSAWYLFPFTNIEAGGMEYLSVAVQLLGVWGAAITLWALAEIELEMAIARKVEKDCSEELSRIESKNTHRIEAADLDRNYLPRNRTEPAPAMLRLFRHICKEAKSRRYESSVHVVQPYREEPLEDIFKLQNLQKIALWIGILGTFIGLLLVIRSSGLEGIETNQQFVGLIRKMFDGLLVSFGASLAGLEVAIILGFFLLLLRRRHQVYFKLMESSTATLLSLARSSVVRDDLLNEFAQITSSVNSLNDRIYDESQELKGKLKAVTDRVNAQTKAIESGLSSLTKAKADFETSLQEVARAQKEFVGDIAKIYSAVSLKDLSVALETGIKRAGKQISDTLEPNVNSISRQLAEFNRMVQALNTATANQSAAITASSQKTERRVAEFAEKNLEAMKDLRGQINEGLGRVEHGVSRSIKADLQQLTRTAISLNSALQRGGYAAPVRRDGGFLSKLKDLFRP